MGDGLLYAMEFRLRLQKFRLKRGSNPGPLVWQVGWLLLFFFWLNGPLRHHFSLYRTVSQREGEREVKR